MSSSSVATGLSYGPPTNPRHAATAVTSALEKAGLDHANSVLLFLTPEFAQNPQPALRAAARAGRCTQIVGCTAPGVITDEEWLLDSCGAAAMVFGGDVFLKPPTADSAQDQHLLTFSTPESVSTEWLDDSVPRVGAVSADIFGHGPFTVWSGGRQCPEGYIEVAFHGVRHSVVASRGIRPLSTPFEVAEAQGFDILRIGGERALNALVKSLPISVRKLDRIPLHLLMYGVTFGDPQTAIRDGRYDLNHIVSANPDDSSITVSHEPTRGEKMFWAMRDELAAERDMARTIERGHDRLLADPGFALLFPCMSRGPSFYGNRDRDVELVKTRFPNMPFIGFYGNGQIAPLKHGSRLYQYSTVLALYCADSAA